MPVIRLCLAPSCCYPRVEGSKYCEKHREQYEAKDKERYVEYLKNKYSSNKSRLPEDKLAYYNTYRWKKTRKDFLAQNPYCVYCGQPAEQIHHDYPEGTDYYTEELFYDESRFVPICAECHRKLRGKKG